MLIGNAAEGDMDRLIGSTNMFGHTRGLILVSDPVARPFHQRNEDVEARLPFRTDSLSAGGHKQNAPKRIEVAADCCPAARDRRAAVVSWAD